MALDYIEQLGMGEPSVEETTDLSAENTNEESVNEDLSLDSEESSEKEVDTEQPNSQIAELQRQIEVMQKRINDKDDFINELRSQAKSKDVKEEVSEGDTNEEEDFWDNPEGKIKSLQKQLEDTARQMKIQQLQIQEGYYANTVENYFKIVNPDSLKEAVSLDTAFAEKFNNSSEPYKVAYEYLAAKQTQKMTEQEKLRAEIRAEVLKEMNVKESREIPPNIANNGSRSGSGSKKDIDSDGFASVFGVE